jgi:hypothetical protein
MRYYVGDDWTIVYELTDPDGQPIDVSTATAQWRLYRVGSSPLVSVAGTCGTGGRVDVLVPSSMTTTLLQGIYTCDLVVTHSPSNKRTYAQTTITVQQRP